MPFSDGSTRQYLATASTPSQSTNVWAAALKAHIDIVNSRANGVVNARLSNQQTRAVDIKDGVQGTDQGGHIVAARFFGPGEQINLYPQSAMLNQIDWKNMENEWAKALDEGKDVKVEIKAIFDGESKRPSRFEVKYWIDGERNLIDFIND